jgi:allantoinase
MSSAPAELAGIGDQAGALTAGRGANFVVLDPDAAFTVEADKLHYRHAVSPYLGEMLHGVVHATYLRGEAVFQNGTANNTPQGRELALS